MGASEEFLIHRYQIPWTSDGSGNASVTPDVVLNGQLLMAEFVPAAGADQPSNNYTATLKDDQGFDILRGRGTGLSNAGASVCAGGVTLADGTTSTMIPAPVSSKLTLAVASAGVTKKGTLYLYLR